MKIVQISTLWERTPPPFYGGTEQVAALVTNGLAERGHDVVLFATGDSRTKGRLKAVYPRPLYREGFPWTESIYPLMNISSAVEYAEKNKFDVIHSHSGYLSIFFSKISKVPMVFTMHGNLRRQILSENQRRALLTHRNANYVSISYDQRKPMKKLRWAGTVYNGIDVDSYKFQPKPHDYLVWIGRISPLKGTHTAIQIARRARKKLIMAGKIDVVDRPYFKHKVKPYIDGKNIVFLGEVTQARKRSLIRNALAFINPVTWNEPFGLVVPEAFAGGTPVVATRKGPMKELIKHGATGYLFSEVDEAVRYVKGISTINRERCRLEAERRFSYQRMAREYENIYKKIA